ncbi:hypothetical protein PPACK8108_LOCUS19334 [Phakopsora pachyrhizi]|uniref:Uncharacterized protein n=1 Tax=Phakopsora pachyrhizi TaxID=170000 RepID=A0AAV0BFA8_PHAPC|nr:hypothetical protein PPACK8108_LOCUS19334 [Phakopsora pachyrhizi]
MSPSLYFSFMLLGRWLGLQYVQDAFHHERSEFDLMLDTLRQGAGVWQTLSASLDSEGVVFAIGSIFAESLKRGHNWTAALLEHASRAKWVSIVWAIMFFVALMWRLYVDFDIIIPVEQHDFGSSHNSSIDEGVEEMQETTMAISPSVTKQSYTLVIREEPTMDISPGTRRPSYNPAIREETEPSISD